MPAISDLNRSRQGTCDSSTVSAVPVACDDLYFGPRPKPRFHRSWLAVGQQVDQLSTFKIADQRAVALSLAPGPVINADHAGRPGRFFGRRANAAQESVLAHRQQKASGECLGRASTEGEAEMAHQPLKPRRTPCIWSGHMGRKSFGENPGRAVHGTAAKSANQQHKFHLTTMGRKIGWSTPISAMNMA